MRHELPLIMLPGMGADARLFQSQLERFPTLRVPAWISPRTGDSLRAYAYRLAGAVDPGVPFIVGGASFGGVVALEMLPHLRARACVLIGSIRSPAELSRKWRLLRPLALLGPERLRELAALGTSVPGLGRKTARRLAKLARPEVGFVRWAMCAVLRWQPTPLPRGVPIFQIHGELDDTLPASLTRADVVVPGGRHALSLFNPTAVNQFLSQILARV